MDIRAVDIARVIAEEESDGTDHVLHLADIAGRNFLHHSCKFRLRRAAGVDKARGNRVHGNPMWGQGLREGPGEDQYPGLRNVMRSQIRLSDDLVRIAHGATTITAAFAAM